MIQRSDALTARLSLDMSVVLQLVLNVLDFGIENTDQIVEID